MANAPLQPDPYEKQVRAQALDTFYRADERLFSTVAIPIAITWAYWGRVDQAILISWFLFALAVAVAMEALCYIYKKRSPPPAEFSRWGRYFTYVLLAQGLYTGMACVLFFEVDSVTHRIFLLFWIVGLSVAAIGQLAHWLEGYYAFTIPALTLTVLRLFMEGETEYQGMAVLLSIALPSLLHYGHHAQKSVFKSIRLRFENLDLIEQLRLEKIKAEISSQDKTRFLAAASHDLRQPVHALSLFVDALHREIAVLTGATDSRAGTLLGNMEHSIHALNQLLGSLLDISKLDAKIVRPNVLHFNVRALLTSLHDEYQIQAQGKGLYFDMQIDGELMTYSDPILLESILRNLIGNALAYTHSGGVAVAATSHGNAVHIEVRDTGIGIAPEQQQEIFREFFQVANAERDRTKGLGLGLAIVERTAALLHCQIKVESAPGKGSVFRVQIPVDAFQVADMPSATTPSTATSGDAADFNLDKINLGLSGMRVLVIDDEIAVRVAMAAVLHGWGCVAILASSEDEAIQNLQGQMTPQVIITDYRLREGKTGADAIKRIHQELGAAIPALIITGDTAPERLHEAQASGHTLMHKPVQPAKLRAFLQRIQRHATPPEFGS